MPHLTDVKKVVFNPLNRYEEVPKCTNWSASGKLGSLEVIQHGTNIIQTYHKFFFARCFQYHNNIKNNILAAPVTSDSNKCNETFRET